MGGFRGLVMGSVSDQCVRHAACPVVVVRAAGTGSDDASSVVLDAGVSDEV
ncbi:MAG: universal stress protein [Actinomycetota bacterium]|nr:universal stress protein [Actinomycetota bacterium]